MAQTVSLKGCHGTRGAPLSGSCTWDLEGLSFPGEHYEGVTFSRSWVPAMRLSDQSATQSQGETAAIANTLCSDAVLEQVVSIQCIVTVYSFSSWQLLAPRDSSWADGASIYPLTLLWEPSSEFFSSCKTGILYPLNTSPKPLIFWFWQLHQIFCPRDQVQGDGETLRPPFPQQHRFRLESVLEPSAMVWRGTR